jgi:hypothetical protein
MRNSKGMEQGRARPSRATLTRSFLILVAVANLPFAVGCSRWNARRTAQALPGEIPTAEQVVAQINRNAERVHSLMAKDLDISSNQAPIPLDGRLALEKPRRFRLLVRMPATKTTVADIGSNDEEFWFYSSQPAQQAALVHCSYEDYGRVQTRMPIQPEWIFDALGFIPLPTDQRHMIRPGKSGTVELVSSTFTPQGQNASLVSVVQLDSGWIVERRLEIPGHPQPIAVATLSRHQKDPTSGVVYPGTVRVAWPEEDLDITIRLQGVEVNTRFDPAMAQALWQMPRNQYSAQDIDLGAGLRVNRTRRPPSASLSPPQAPSASLSPPPRRSRTDAAYP